MKISIVGTGYVGLVTGVCLADSGNTVYCVDNDESKIKSLKSGIIPIYEPGLKELTDKNVKLGRLYFTKDLKEAVKKPTPCLLPSELLLRITEKRICPTYLR